MKKLAIITTHPIQYYAPVFQRLAVKIDLKVFYTWGQATKNKYDPGFGKVIDWDLPLLDGYAYEYLENVSRDPGSHHFGGIITPTLTTNIEAFRPDVIMIYGYAYHSHLKAMRYFKGKIPVWFRGDSTLLDEKIGPKAMLKWLLLRWVYRHVDKVLHVGGASKAYFKRYGIRERQLIHVPHAIDNDRFAFDRTAEAQALRRSLGLLPDDKLILFAGKLESKKAPDLLLKAFQMRNVPKEHLLFVGNGELETRIKAGVTGENIHFLDMLNQQKMPVIYQACDLFCLPSRGPGETWGLSVNEAMAAGRAVLLSDSVGCAEDLVKNKLSGEIFRSNDIGDLLDKLDMLLSDRDVLIQRGIYAAELIKNHSFDVQVELLTDLLNHV